MNGMIAAQGSKNMPLLSNDYKPTEALLVGSRATARLATEHREFRADVYVSGGRVLSSNK